MRLIAAIPPFTMPADLVLLSLTVSFDPSNGDCLLTTSSSTTGPVFGVPVTPLAYLQASGAGGMVVHEFSYDQGVPIAKGIVLSGQNAMGIFLKFR